MLAEVHTGNGSMETIGGTNATKGIRPANPRTSAGTGTSFKFTKDFFSTCIPELLAPDFSPEALPEDEEEEEDADDPVAKLR
jgi:hypothetical protein